MASVYAYLTLAELQALRTTYLEALMACNQRQSYSLNGRSMTYRNIAEIEATLEKILDAMADKSGDAPTSTRVSFTGL